MKRRRLVLKWVWLTSADSAMIAIGASAEKFGGCEVG